jgi:hypothetical protein
MIEVVENKNEGVIRCRVVYVHTKWATLNRNVFEFVDELQTAACQQGPQSGVSPVVLTSGNVRPGSPPPPCKDFFSHSKVTMLVLQHQHSLLLTRNKYEAPRTVLTMMSWTNYMEHIL